MIGGKHTCLETEDTLNIGRHPKRRNCCLVELYDEDYTTLRKRVIDKCVQVGRGIEVDPGRAAKVAAFLYSEFLKYATKLERRPRSLRILGRLVPCLLLDSLLGFFCPPEL